MSGRLLVDLTPGGGAHGVRGIGSYVRGIATALAVAPPAARERVSLLLDGDQHAPEGYPAVRASVAAGWRPQDLGWAIRWAMDGVALHRTGARALHITDPRAAIRPPLARSLVVTAYDLIPLEPEVRRATRAHRRAIYTLYLRTLRSAERVIAISATTAAAVSQALDVDPARVDVVYPVVSTPDASIDRDPDPDPTFLFVGVPDSHKRPELAIQALATFRARHGAGRLRMVGPAARAHVERVRDLARSAGVEEWIAIEGKISSAALEDALRSAAALLAVSRVEGFGLPPVEAVLRGVPVIAVDTPVARETLSSAVRFVAPEPAAIADAMEAPAVPAPDARNELAARYSASAVSDALWGSYERLLVG